MSGLTEDLVRQITERVTREVLAAIHETDSDIQVVEEWPEWDEFAGEPVAPPEPVVSEPPGVSVLRQRSRGAIPAPVVIDEPEVAPAGNAKGRVQPLDASGSVNRVTGSGFNPDPHANGDWFVRNFQKDVLNQRRQPPAEDRVTTVRI